MAIPDERECQVLELIKNECSKDETVEPAVRMAWMKNLRVLKKSKDPNDKTKLHPMRKRTSTVSLLKL